MIVQPLPRGSSYKKIGVSWIPTGGNVLVAWCAVEAVLLFVRTRFDSLRLSSSSWEVGNDKRKEK